MILFLKLDSKKLLVCTLKLLIRTFKLFSIKGWLGLGTRKKNTGRLASYMLCSNIQFSTTRVQGLADCPNLLTCFQWMLDCAVWPCLYCWGGSLKTSILVKKLFKTAVLGSSNVNVNTLFRDSNSRSDINLASSLQ